MKSEPFVKLSATRKQRAIPFKTNTPSVEDFGKVYHREKYEFSNATTFCVIFRLGSSQREYIFNLEVPNELFYFEFTLQLCQTLFKKNLHRGCAWK